MAGYNGYSMSNNAVSAYENGEKPLSKWTKTDILDEIARYCKSEYNYDYSKDIKRKTAEEFKSYFLIRTSWHHVSSYYNKIDFYSINYDKLTVQDIIKFKSFCLNKVKNDTKEEKWLAEYLIWSGTRKHPKASVVKSEGVVKGNWFYLSDGTKKKIDANGFRLISRL